MLRTLIPTVAALACLAGPTLAAADDITLLIPDSSGRMQTQNNLKQVGLAATLQGCQGGSGPGRTTISGPEIPSSQTLAAAVTGGTRIPQGVMHIRKAGGRDETYYKVELHDFLVSSAQPVSPTGGLPQTLTLSYGGMSWTARGGGCGG